MCRDAQMQEFVDDNVVLKTAILPGEVCGKGYRAGR